MAESFVIEGSATLTYCAGDSERGVILTEGGTQKPIEEAIAEKLNFPDNEEFDQMLQTIRDRRASSDPYPIGNEPDMVRQGVRLRVTVEVL